LDGDEGRVGMAHVARGAWPTPPPVSATDLCSHAVTVTFDLLTLNFYSTSGVVRLNPVQNFSEIE